MIKAIGQPAGVLGLRVRYETIASGLEYLTAAPADQTLPRRLHYYFEFDLTILDEIGFNGVERPESPQCPLLVVRADQRPLRAFDDTPAEKVKQDRNCCTHHLCIFS